MGSSRHAADDSAQSNGNSLASSPPRARARLPAASEMANFFSSVSESFVSFRGKRLQVAIVIVAPEDDQRDALCWALELMGCQVHPFSNPKSTLEMLGNPPVDLFVDLFLCDLELSKELLTGLDGQQVSVGNAEGEGSSSSGSNATSPSRKPPVVIMCEKRSPRSQISAGLDDGASNYVTKPLRIQAIRSVILRHTASGAASSELPAEKGLNRYEKLRQVGKGAFGEVFEVRRCRDGARFALKELATGRLSTKQQRCVLNELKLHIAFDSPCVIRCYTSWMHDDVACLLLEYMEGGSLATEVERCQASDEKISDARILDWAAQVVIGLLYLHSKSIVHRDLKLENILGPALNDQVKIADFGISKRLERGIATTMVGTPLIMAPEVCTEALVDADNPGSCSNSNEGYGPECDLWSLGVVLYELATLQPPFKVDESASQTQQQRLLFGKICHDEPPPLPYGRAAELDRLIIRGLLQKKPLDRPSVWDLCKDPMLSRAIHRFLTRHKLQNHPSVLEVLDVLPADQGSDLIESLDLNVVTLKNSLASPAGSSAHLDASRLRSTDFAAFKAILSTQQN